MDIHHHFDIIANHFCNSNFLKNLVTGYLWIFYIILICFDNLICFSYSGSQLAETLLTVSERYQAQHNQHKSQPLPEQFRTLIKKNFIHWSSIQIVELTQMRVELSFNHLSKGKNDSIVCLHHSRYPKILNWKSNSSSKDTVTPYSKNDLKI